MKRPIHTGSTAEMRAPNNSASIGSWVSTVIHPARPAASTKYPIMKVETRVPTTAKATMLPKFRKKDLRRSVYLKTTGVCGCGSER